MQHSWWEEKGNFFMDKIWVFSNKKVSEYEWHDDYMRDPGFIKVWMKIIEITQVGFMPDFSLTINFLKFKKNW